jgi:hypothetical protein
MPSAAGRADASDEPSDEGSLTVSVNALMSRGNGWPKLSI